MLSRERYAPSPQRACAWVAIQTCYRENCRSPATASTYPQVAIQTCYRENYTDCHFVAISRPCCNPNMLSREHWTNGTVRFTIKGCNPNMLSREPGVPLPQRFYHLQVAIQTCYRENFGVCQSWNRVDTLQSKHAIARTWVNPNQII